MKRWLDRIFTNDIVKFLVVGGASTAFDFILYMSLSTKMDITVSKGISMIAASIFSYFVNKRYTFDNKKKTTLAYLIRYYVIFALNLSVNLGMNYVMFICTNNKLISFVCATLSGMTVNYIGQKFYVFKQ